MVDRAIMLMRYCYKNGHKNTEIRKHIEKERIFKKGKEVEDEE